MSIAKEFVTGEPDEPFEMPEGFEEIGVVGVDSGQLILCDPCYLGDEWMPTDFVDIRIFNVLWEGATVRVQFRVDFEVFSEPLPQFGGLSMNDLSEKGLAVQMPSDHQPNGEFSYNGCCRATLSDANSGQLNYAKGHAGVAVAFSSGYGDGVYPVIARKDENGRVVEVRVIME